MSSQQRSRMSDKEMNDLIAKLQELLPESRRRNLGRGSPSSSKVLKETCSYIKSLHQEADDLSARLSHLISTVDPYGPQADIIRSLFRP